MAGGGGGVMACWNHRRSREPQWRNQRSGESGIVEDELCSEGPGEIWKQFLYFKNIEKHSSILL
jgi:hypothetical protein